MEKRNILASFLFLFSILCGVHGFVTSDCNDGSSWVHDFIKYECFEISEATGYEPTACVPSDEDDGKEYEVDEVFQFKNIRYKCMTDESDVNKMWMEKLGCATNDNSILGFGERLELPNGTYHCNHLDNGDVEFEFTSAPECVDAEHVNRKIGEEWQDQHHIHYRCIRSGSEAEIEIQGIILRIDRKTH